MKILENLIGLRSPKHFNLQFCFFVVKPKTKTKKTVLNFLLFELFKHISQKTKSQKIPERKLFAKTK
jgi:hypothetical protein